jgi:hypothetical protein
MQSETLIRKIESLPPEAIAEVEDFVDFIRLKTQKTKSRKLKEEIAEYAGKHAGSDVDLDEELETAAIELLLKENEK